MALNLKSKALAFGLTGVLAVGVIGGGVAMAEGDGPGDVPGVSSVMGHFHRHPIAAARIGAKAIMNTCGLTREDLQAGAQNGQTINDILTAKGQDPAQCKADVLQKLDDRLTEAVNNGKITDEQKANALEKASAGLDKLMSHVLGSRGGAGAS